MNAVIYCRVSTEEQVGNFSLASQEKTCIEYCKKNDINVDRIFVEEGESAKTTDRPVFQEALTYCRKNIGKVQYLLVYKVNRFARNHFDHAATKGFLAKYGVSLRSATEHFDGSAVGKLTENMLATFAQFDNDQKAETTATGMKAALCEGRWPFSPPIGYRAGRDSKDKPILLYDEVRAPHIIRAFEQFASGNFTKRQVLNSVNSAGLRTRNGRLVAPQTFDKILENRIYAGFVCSPTWQIEAKGLHAPLITEGLFNTVQAILKGKKLSVTPHVRNHPDFPLRQSVRCGRCGKPLTGSWSRGRNQKYPYYRCPKAGCLNVRKDMLERLFLELLENLRPQADALLLFEAIVVDVWNQKQGDAAEFINKLEHKLTESRERKRKLMDAFLDKRVRQDDYDESNDAIRQEISALEMELHATKLEELDIEELLGFAKTVLSQPSRLWFDADCDQKQRLQKVIFPEGLTFENGQFGTASTGSFFSYLDRVVEEKTSLASPTGFEPVLSP